MANDKEQGKDTVAAIDAAVKKAQARREAAPTGEQATANPVAKPAKKAPLTDEEKVAKKAEHDAEVLRKKAERDKIRDEKAKAKEASKKPAHMSKVDSAAKKLPSLSAAANVLYVEATTGLDAADITALGAHLEHFNRVKATERALGAKVSNGDTVRIVTPPKGHPELAGKEGTVTKSQRIRCYVSIDGVDKDVYLFTSDVEVLAHAPAAEAEPAQATG